MLVMSYIFLVKMYSFFNGTMTGIEHGVCRSDAFIYCHGIPALAVANTPAHPKYTRALKRYKKGKPRGDLNQYIRIGYPESASSSAGAQVHDA